MTALSSFPRWLRIAFIAGLTLFAIGAGAVIVRFFTQPVNLTLAVGSSDGEAARMMSMIAGRLTETGAPVRLTVVDKGNVLDAAKAFAAGEVDLAIVRSDAGDLSRARTVIHAGNAAAMIVVPPGSSIESVGDLKDKTVGVIGLETNRRLVDTLLQNYQLAPGKVNFVDLPATNIRASIQSKKIQALFVVVPLTEKYISLVRSFFSDKQVKLSVVPIDAAEAIANVAQHYESFDLPKGSLRGSPPIPDDDVATLRVAFYLVASEKLSEDTVASLAKSIMDARRALVGELPLLAQFVAPSTDKDAAIAIHPGASAFFEGTQKTVIEKYGDYLYYGPMLLGLIGSVVIAAWNFMGFGASEKTTSPLDTVYGLARRIRNADNEDELHSIEEEIDNILQAALTKYSEGDANAADAAALSLAVHRIEHLIGHRRTVLNR